MTDTARRSAKRTPAKFTVAFLATQFNFASLPTPAGHSPAIGRTSDGYYIRIHAGTRARGNTATHTFDYFYLDADGTITTAPRGYAKDYKPGVVTDIAEAAERYAGGDR